MRRKRSYLESMFHTAKVRSKRKGIEFTITLADLTIPETCPLLGMQIVPGSDDVNVRPSIDRIDHKQGYTKCNVWVVSCRANRIKSDATANELIKIGKALLGDRP